MLFPSITTDLVNFEVDNDETGSRQKPSCRRSLSNENREELRR